MISGVSKVVLPVDDQERAKEFWTNRMGFELRRDESYGDERWIEVSPPDGSPLLVLSRRTPRRTEAGRAPTSCRTRRCSSTAPTSSATYYELSQRGVEFSAPPRRQHFGWWSLFEDPDGTRYALGQWS